nr:Qat anti-phage system associated protein QatB [Mesorhizobium sp. M8A.F.Ca.ET.218.01.1.1]
MAGTPAAEVFETLADIICPAGGTIDEAIAREAMLAAAAELAASGVTFDALSAEALEAVFLGTIARSIEDKLFNELGSKAVRLPDDTAAVDRIERQLHDFVTGAVRDAFAGADGGIATLDIATVDATVAEIYERTFEVLQVLGDNA